VNHEDKPAMPGARLTIVTTPPVVDRLVALMNTGLFGRSLAEAAERVLVRGLEELLHLVDPDDHGAGVTSRPYRCGSCGREWLAAFDGEPDPVMEYAAECPACHELAGQPIAQDRPPGPQDAPGAT